MIPKWLWGCARKPFYALVGNTLLRAGSTRRVWFGPYRGLVFELSAPLLGRRSIFYRSYEPTVTRWLQRNVKPGMVVWNIGAHAGIHALYIARLLQGKGQVLAFEGWPDNVASLRRNVTLNPGLRDVLTVIPLCVARQTGVVRMVQGSSDGKHHLAGEDEPGTLELQATALDDFWSEVGTCPDILIIDIEGYEQDALEGGMTMIEACKPRLVLEHHRRVEALLKWLDAHSYTVERRDARHVFAY
ncbi:MAG: hypothetical protein Kow00106_07270 [Anaerolineae bacterium]